MLGNLLITQFEENSARFNAYLFITGMNVSLNVPAYGFLISHFIASFLILITPHTLPMCYLWIVYFQDLSVNYLQDTNKPRFAL